MRARGAYPVAWGVAVAELSDALPRNERHRSLPPRPWLCKGRP
jgi:hypothetical protein